jgi:hypothetical protein
MIKTFREWFFNDYLMQSPLSSQLLIGNKSVSERQERICQIAELIIENENKLVTVEHLREEIAMKYFVTMRCSGEYLFTANMYINKYKEFIKHKKP